MSWDDLQGVGVQHRHSARESARFGLTVGRVTVGWSAPMPSAEDDLRRVLDTAAEQLLIVRWPSRLTRLASVPASSGRRVIPADVLMYWERTALPTGEGSAGTVDDGLSTVVADSEFDAELLVPLISDSFDEYANHYSANPMLARDAALAGYVEWARGALTDESSDVVVLRRAGEPVGFATLAHSVEGEALEILLAGLAPSAQGRGWYRSLIAAVGELASARGLGRVIISTQAHNVRVQRAWAAMGFRPFAAFTTAHAMRSDSAKAETHG